MMCFACDSTPEGPSVVWYIPNGIYRHRTKFEQSELKRADPRRVPIFTGVKEGVELVELKADLH